VVRLNMAYALQGTPHCLNRIYLHYTGTPPTSLDLGGFCNAVTAAWATNLRSLFGPQMTFGPPNAEDLGSSSGASGAGSGTSTGSRTGLAIAAGSSINVRFLIARRYRGGKPKVYLSAGEAADVVAGNLWSGAMVTATATGWQAFMSAILPTPWTGAGTVSHVNVSYYNGFTVVTNPVTGRARNVPTLRGTPLVDTITGYSVDPQMGSQRRRNLNT
jgi:hypothetical protein